MRARASRAKVLSRGFSGAILFVVASWLLFAGIAADRRRVIVGAATSSSDVLKHWTWNEGVSKRRVPNGPDPIHNRRVVKTRQTPSA